MVLVEQRVGRERGRQGGGRALAVLLVLNRGGHQALAETLSQEILLQEILRAAGNEGVD